MTRTTLVHLLGPDDSRPSILVRRLPASRICILVRAGDMERATVIRQVLERTHEGQPGPDGSPPDPFYVKCVEVGDPSDFLAWYRAADREIAAAGGVAVVDIGDAHPQCAAAAALAAARRGIITTHGDPNDQHGPRRFSPGVLMSEPLCDFDLVVLEELERGSSGISELARKLRRPKNTVSAALTRLRGGGFVKRWQGKLEEGGKEQVNFELHPGVRDTLPYLYETGGTSR